MEAFEDKKFQKFLRLKAFSVLRLTKIAIDAIIQLQIIIPFENPPSNFEFLRLGTTTNQRKSNHFILEQAGVCVFSTGQTAD